MALVRQPKTAGFRVKSRYNIFINPGTIYFMAIKVLRPQDFQVK